MASESSEDTAYWATVRFEEKYSKQRILDAPVSHIMVEYMGKRGKTKRKPFLPTSTTDFEATNWYVVFVGPNGEFDGPRDDFPSYYALIGRMAETQRELKSKKWPRLHWPTVAEKGQDTALQMEDSSGAEQFNIVDMQEKDRLERNKKRKADDVELLRELEAKKHKLEQGRNASFSSGSSGVHSQLSAFLQASLPDLLYGVRKEVQSLMSEVFAEVKSLGAGMDSLKAEMDSLKAKAADMKTKVADMFP